MHASDAEGEPQWRLIRDLPPLIGVEAVKIGPDDPRWYRRADGVYATEREAQAAARAESHAVVKRQKRARKLLGRGQKRNPLADAVTMWKRVMAGMPEITDPNVGYKQGGLRLSYTYQLPTGHKVRVNLNRIGGGVGEADPVSEQILLEGYTALLRYHAARTAGLNVARVQPNGPVLLIPDKC